MNIGTETIVVNTSKYIYSILLIYFSYKGHITAIWLKYEDMSTIQINKLVLTGI